MNNLKTFDDYVDNFIFYVSKNFYISLSSVAKQNTYLIAIKTLVRLNINQLV